MYLKHQTTIVYNISRVKSSPLQEDLPKLCASLSVIKAPFRSLMRRGIEWSGGGEIRHCYRFHPM